MKITLLYLIVTIIVASISVWFVPVFAELCLLAVLPGMVITLLIDNMHNESKGKI